MSSNFTGVTFAKQKIAPADDAIIRRAVLTDGILTGCALSYSGSTLTMAAGQLLVCGRQIRHPSSQNWAVVDATSGYARVVLTIDLTRTASKDVFDQVLDTIEYASSADGFAALEQADVNASGVRYQVVLAVVSLGTGGITGIVSQLQKCEGGGGLNFKVVGGTTQPAGPAENTIWVNTPTEITGYVFAVTPPERPTAGTVWISTGTNSPAAFNAEKKNGLWIYPTGCKQYVSGAWVTKTAQTYQNGAWVSWYTYLLADGVTMAALGSWTDKMRCSFTGGKIVCSAAIDSEAEGLGGWCFPTAFDVTNYKTLYVKLQITETQTAGISANRPLMVGFFSSIAFVNYNAQKSYAMATTMLAEKAGAEQTVSVSLEEVTGSYYLAGLSMLAKYALSELYLD